MAALPNKKKASLRKKTVTSKRKALRKGPKRNRAARIMRRRQAKASRRRRLMGAGWVPLTRYQSMFSVDVPPIPVQSGIWDVIRERLPPGYTIPDPAFRRFLKKG